MRSGLWLVILASLAGGGWFFFQQYDLQGLDGVRLVPRHAAEGADYRTPVAGVRGQTIRVASFNIQVFGSTKLAKPHVMDVLARIGREFDVLAIQEIRSRSDDILPQYVELLNQAGRHYDYVIGPRVGRTSSTEQYAFVFDTDSVEVDRSQLYTVEDPEDLLHRPPLVAWFRVRGPPPDQAFTFSLVTVHVDPDTVQEELDLMDDVLHLVRDDGRGEDDVILLGDLNASDRQLGQLAQLPGLVAVIQSLPTNTRATAQYDNILLQLPATQEFTGQGSVYDFMRQYNLTLQEALEISDHLPVWAEFSVWEGGVTAAVSPR